MCSLVSACSMRSHPASKCSSIRCCTNQCLKSFWSESNFPLLKQKSTVVHVTAKVKLSGKLIELKPKGSIHICLLIFCIKWRHLYLDCIRDVLPLFFLILIETMRAVWFSGIFCPVCNKTNATFLKMFMIYRYFSRQVT